MDIVSVILLLALLLAVGCTSSSFVLQTTPTRTTKNRNNKSPSSTTRLHMDVVECDVAIVGGGPAGCACALYTARADLKTVILDKNPSVGALAITSHIANYP